MNIKRFIGVVTATFFVAWLLLVLLSWLLSATMVPGVRSLLTGEGLRWFFSHLVDGIATPMLVWLLMAAMAGGCLARCGIFNFQSSTLNLRSRPLRLALLLLLAYIFLLSLLTAVPHAALLSATGTLSHSPFSRAIVPLAAAAVVLFSVAYGLVAHAFESLADITDAMVFGLAKAAPLLFVYIAAMVFLRTLNYVF